jgi:long-chain fatty acid transport protein
VTNESIGVRARRPWMGSAMTSDGADVGSRPFARGRGARGARAAIAVVAAMTAGLAAEERAEAAGFYVAEHGVRPLGRAGAFTAGGDDVGVITYNPAGIYDAGSQFQFDASYLNFSVDYTRQALLRQVDPNTGETVGTYKQTFPKVTGNAPFLPIPTIAGSFSPHPDWMLAFGAYAPYAAIPTYPDKVNGLPAPQRYSLQSLEGSLLAVLGAYVAWAPIRNQAPKNLRLGLGLEFLVGQFTARKVMSGCLPERFFCSPEDASWDVLSEIKAAPIITPSGTIGFQWEFAKGFRLGGSFHLPFWVRAPATIKTRLPSTPVFDKATQDGEDATIKFALPFVVRLGLEWRDMTPGMRIALDGTYEQWSMHDVITVTPKNLPGFPQKYFIPDVTIPRGLQNTASVRLGGEYSIKASSSVHVIPRVGVSYESSAVPKENLSVLLVDSGKVTTSLGFGVEIDRVRLDAVFAHLFTQSVTVEAEQARLQQTLPLSANPPKNPDYINGGVYKWSANVIGLGLTYTFGHPDKPKPAPEKTLLPTTEEEKKPAEAKPPEPPPEPKAAEPEPKPPEPEATTDAADTKPGAKGAKGKGAKGTANQGNGAKGNAKGSKAGGSDTSTDDPTPPKSSKPGTKK